MHKCFVCAHELFLITGSCARFYIFSAFQLIYTDHFQNYVKLVESYILDAVHSKLPDFSLPDFINIIQNQKDLLDSDVFDILYSMSDFLHFKGLMLAQKYSKEINIMPEDCLLVTSVNGLNIS